MSSGKRNVHHTRASEVHKREAESDIDSDSDSDDEKPPEMSRVSIVVMRLLSYTCRAVHLRAYFIYYTLYVFFMPGLLSS